MLLALLLLLLLLPLSLPFSFSPLQNLPIQELREKYKLAGGGDLIKKKDILQYFAENAPQTTSEPVSLTTSPPISPTTTTTTTTTTTPSASRMPPLLDTGDPDSDAPLDSRSSHPFLQSTPPSDMDVTFIGTASCSPSFTRGVSCTALRITSNERGATTLGGTWLFDAGEGTQLQLQASPVTKSKISKIFITHAHGDHTFGLPGLLCFLGMDRDRTVEPAIEIYGPEGLREWLRATVRYSSSRICPNYRVHELKNVPMAPGWTSFLSRKRIGGYRLSGKHIFEPPRSPAKHWKPDLPQTSNDEGSYQHHSATIGDSPSALALDSNFGELPGGRDIYPEYGHPESYLDAPVWTLIEDDLITVKAAPMSHGVPCVGFAIKERDKPGRVKADVAMPVIKRNSQALKDNGVRNPLKLMGHLKQLQPGESMRFPDDTVLYAEDVIEPERPGRKVVILGDTCDASAISNLAMNCDLLIHEATNAYLHGIDDGSPTDHRVDTMKHGHSTPIIAGNFARHVKAKRLALNHFSSRYKGDDSEKAIVLMERIEAQAVKASQLDKENVIAAWDRVQFSVPQNETPN